MTEPFPPSDEPTPNPGADPTAVFSADQAEQAEEAARAAAHRGAHRAPAKPQRWIGIGLIAVASIIALLVAFSSCSTNDDDNPAPPVTTPPSSAPATTAPSTTAPPTSAAPTSAAPTTAAATTPAPAPTTPAPTTAAATTPPATAARMPVVVLNGTRTTGLAARTATQVRSAGWSVASTGNWRSTTVGETTIFYPAGDEAAAVRLARELSGSQEIAPALAGMSTSRLTIVVA